MGQPAADLREDPDGDFTVETGGRFVDEQQVRPVE
jgi:hypothetical protein